MSSAQFDYTRILVCAGAAASVDDVQNQIQSGIGELKSEVKNSVVSYFYTFFSLSTSLTQVSFFFICCTCELNLHQQYARLDALPFLYFKLLLNCACMFFSFCNRQTVQTHCVQIY